MPSSASSHLAWETALKDAAAAFNGGPRSFPPSRDSDIATKYLYQPPNKDYERLLRPQIQPRQRQSIRTSPPYSAGWLLPDEFSVCTPVFVAHSTLAAIWLIRETLADDVLSADAWQRLVSAAQTCTGGLQHDTPLAAPPPFSPRSCASPPRLEKRSAVSTSPTQDLAKRHRCSAAALSAEQLPPSRTLPPRTTAPLLPPPQQSADLGRLTELAVAPQMTVSLPSGKVVDETIVRRAHVSSITNSNSRAEHVRIQRRKRALAKEKKKKIAGELSSLSPEAAMERNAYASMFARATTYLK